MIVNAKQELRNFDICMVVTALICFVYFMAQMCLYDIRQAQESTQQTSTHCDDAPP